MAASYPTTPKAFTTKAAAQTIQPAHVNDLQDEVTAIETALLTGGLAHAVTITAGAGGASLTLPATGRLYLDGGSNTYLLESSADAVQIFCGGALAVGIGTDGMAVQATKKFYLDGGNNTYLVETVADTLVCYVGGSAILTLTTSGLTLSGGAVTYGANDSGGTGYRLLRVPNA